MHEKALENFMEDFHEVKFKGILAGIDLSKWNDELVKFLIDIEIFVECECEYFQAYPYEEDSSEFNPIICYKGKNYELNPIIFAEIYLELKSYAISMSPLFQDKIEKIFYKVNTKVYKKDKIKFLKKQFKKNFPEDVDFESYSNLVDGSNELFGVSIAWYENIYDVLVSQTDYNVILKYLKTKYSPSDGYDFDLFLINELEEVSGFGINYSLADIVEKWSGFYVKEIILSDLKSEIGRLKAPKYEQVKSDYSELVEIDSSIGFSALEAALYVFYMKNANLSIFDIKDLSLKEFYIKLGEKFGCNGKNIEMDYGKLLKHKEYRFKLTKNRISKLEKVLKVLPEKAKFVCQNDLDFIKKNL